MREAALARASRLSPEAREALEAAAAIGGRIPPALLRTVSESPPAAVEECLASGILVDDGRTLSFRHELIRRAVEAARARRPAASCSTAAWSTRWKSRRRRSTTAGSRTTRRARTAPEPC